MRKLAYEYYLKNGSLDNIQYSDVGADGNCYPTSFYSYWIGSKTSTWLDLAATRCGSGGKSPDASRQYVLYLTYYPGTSQSGLHCRYVPYDGSSACFGLPY